MTLAIAALPSLFPGLVDQESNLAGLEATSTTQPMSTLTFQRLLNVLGAKISESGVWGKATSNGFIRVIVNWGEDEPGDAAVGAKMIKSFANGRMLNIPKDFVTALIVLMQKLSRDGRLAGFEGLDACGCKYGGGGMASCDVGYEAMAGLDALGDVLPDPLIPWGASFAAAVLTGLHGYRRGGALGALLWAAGGYYAPLPAASIAAYQELNAGQHFERRFGMTLPQAIRRGSRLRSR